MFKYNGKAKYAPNGGRYLQIVSEKDLYLQTIVVSIKDIFSSDDTFLANFPNNLVNYPLNQMRFTNTKWKHWNKAPLKLWQTQLNIAVFCASSACGVSSEHLNYKKHSMVKSLYRFHVYYYVGRVLKRLQVPLLHEAGFNPYDNSYTKEEFFKLCEDYEVSQNMGTISSLEHTSTR